jgi:AhpD family alkylhydroperoxidase
MNASPRLQWAKLAPKAMEAMLGVSATIASSSIGKKLVDLVQTRISQINGCAFCLDMHVRDLRQEGEDWQRLNSLATWREVAFFSERERAALNWAESLTRLPEHHGARDAEFEALKAVFSDLEIVELTVAIAQINAWNRMGVGMALPVAAKPMP